MKNKLLFFRVCIFAVLVFTGVTGFGQATDVPDIASLRSGATNGTIYRLTGEAILTAQDATHNRKFLEDETGAIMIFDDEAIIETTYNIGDGISNLTGVLQRVNNMLRFVPGEDPGQASSTGNPVHPQLTTIRQVTPSEQAKLVRLENVRFTSTGILENERNYIINDGTNNLVLRTDFPDVDYIGMQITANQMNITGVIIQNNNVMQIVPRNKADMKNIYNVEFNVYMHGVDFDPQNDVVYITGDFIDWAEPGTAHEQQLMNPRQGNSMVYNRTFQLEEGSYDYKYFLNNGWDNGEWQGETNRQLLVERNISTRDVFGIMDPETLPFLEDFQTYNNQQQFEETSNWTIIDQDNDGHNWFLYAEEQTRVMASQSRHPDDGALVTENYLITPPLLLPALQEGDYVSVNWEVASSHQTRFAENYKVMISTTGTDPEDFTQVLFEETLTEDEANWRFQAREQRFTDLHDRLVYIAFVHTGSPDQDMLLIDNVHIRVNEIPLVTFRVHMHAVEGFDPEVDEVYITGSYIQWAEPGSHHMATFMRPDPEDPMIYWLYWRIPEGTVEYKYFLNEGWDGGEWSGPPNRVVEVDGTMTINNVFGQMDDTFRYAVDFEVEDEQGEQVNNATFILNDELQQTGDYSFMLEPGTYNYRVVKIGYLPETGTFELVDAPLNRQVVLREDPDVFIADIPFTEDFEEYDDTADFLASSNWTRIDADEDGHNWFLLEEDENQLMASHSRSPEAGALIPDNYLITPAIRIPETEQGQYLRLSFDVATASATNYAESFRVMISALGRQQQDFTIVLHEETLTQAQGNWQFATRELNLNEYQDQVVYIAFVHEGSMDVDMLLLDNVMLTLEELPTYTVTFNLHMHATEFTPATDQVYITGSMMGWAEPGSDHENQVLVPTDEDPMVYTITMELAEGTYDYKFFLNSGWDGGEWEGEENREVLVTADMTIVNVFGDPDNTTVPVTEPEAVGLTVFPVPARDNLNIVSDQRILQLRIFDLVGRTIYQARPQEARHVLNVSAIDAGIYILQIQTTAGVATQRIQIHK